MRTYEEVKDKIDEVKRTYSNLLAIPLQDIVRIAPKQVNRQTVFESPKTGNMYEITFFEPKRHDYYMYVDLVKTKPFTSRRTVLNTNSTEMYNTHNVFTHHVTLVKRGSWEQDLYGIFLHLYNTLHAEKVARDNNRIKQLEEEFEKNFGYI